MRKIMISSILALMMLTIGVGCDNNDKKEEETTVEKVTTTEIKATEAETTEVATTEITDKEFVERKDGFVKYVKDIYNVDAEIDAQNSFFHSIYDEDEKFQAKIGYIYFESDDMAKQYIETAVKMFKEEALSDVKLGDEAVLYTPEEPEDKTAEKWPYYLFVRVGKHIYYSVYYDGYEEVSNTFMDAIVK